MNVSHMSEVSFWFFCAVFPPVSPGGLLHSHVPLRDAAGAAHQRADSTWSSAGGHLLPVPRALKAVRASGTPAHTPDSDPTLELIVLNSLNILSA